MKKKLIIACSMVAVLLLAGGLYVWYQYSQFQKVEIITVDPLLTIYKGGGNSIVLTTKDGTKALVVDSKMGSAARVLRNDVRAADITIVNTHDHSDHAGGNGSSESDGHSRCVRERNSGTRTRAGPHIPAAP